MVVVEVGVLSQIDYGSIFIGAQKSLPEIRYVRLDAGELKIAAAFLLCPSV